MLHGLEMDKVSHTAKMLIVEPGRLYSGPSLESQPVDLLTTQTIYLLRDEHLSEAGKQAVQAGFRPVIIQHPGGFELVYQATAVRSESKFQSWLSDIRHFVGSWGIRK